MNDGWNCVWGIIKCMEIWALSVFLCFASDSFSPCLSSNEGDNDGMTSSSRFDDSSDEEFVELSLVPFGFDAVIFRFARVPQQKGNPQGGQGHHSKGGPVKLK